MKYINVKNINEARKNFTTIFEEVLNSKEIICKNGKSISEGQISIISTELLVELLSKYEFNPEITFDEKTKLFDIQLREIGQFAYAETIELAKEELIDMVEDYIEDYLEKVDVFRRFDGYKEHYPYILKLAHLENKEAIKNEIFKI